MNARKEEEKGDSPPPVSAEPVASPSPTPASTDPNQIELQEKAAENKEPRKPDALIVAALMGNSIAKFNRNAKKNRLNAQVSAPMKLTHSAISEPGPNTVSATVGTTTTTVAGTPTSLHHQKINAVLDRFKSLQPTSHTVDTAGAINPNYQDTKSSNTSVPTSPIDSTSKTTVDTNTAAQSSSKKNTLNSSKLAVNATNSANSRVIGSKASKCTLYFCSNFII